MANARMLAAQALYRVERDRAWSNLALDAALKKYGPDARDSAFAGALFYGVLERTLTLDACIAAHSSVKPRKLSLPVLLALRIGMYQLLYMDGVPDSAAVMESVALARALNQGRSAGLVNAVLRAFLRADKALPVPPDADADERLSLEYSCPAPLVRLWREAYGERALLEILAGSLGRPPLTVRANTLKITPEALCARLEARGARAVRDADLPACLTLENAGAAQKLPEYREGLFHIQDKASQLCAQAVGARPGMRVLDACAAPGGKSFVMAQDMEDRGEIVAADLHGQRLPLISRRARELGIACIRTQQADMTEPGALGGSFSRVLCDVPCSGLGVIRRKPEIKYKALEEFSGLPETQYKILENSANYCQAGAVLVYSTCTLNPAENEEVAERFLRARPDFAPAPLPGAPDGAWRRTLLPGGGTDGFFIARFAKITEA